MFRVVFVLTGIADVVDDEIDCLICIEERGLNEDVDIYKYYIGEYI